VELGRLTHTPTPHISTVYALVKLLAKTMEEERGQVCLQPVTGVQEPAPPYKP
jgi:2-dehydropantoate 2-reductase